MGSLHDDVVMARTPRRRREPRPVLTPEEHALFLEAIEGTTPLPARDRTPLAPPTPRPVPVASTRAMRDIEPPPSRPITAESAGEFVSGRGAGVSHAQIAELRAGRIRPEDTIDLHGKNAADAEAALRRFLVDAQRLHRRCVLIVHGRGLHSDGVAI